MRAYISALRRSACNSEMTPCRFGRAESEAPMSEPRWESAVHSGASSCEEDSSISCVAPREEPMTATLPTSITAWPPQQLTPPLCGERCCAWCCAWCSPVAVLAAHAAGREPGAEPDDRLRGVSARGARARSSRRRSCRAAHLPRALDAMTDGAA
eukprot:5275997-Pleurochrysis_carterae.AAC.1